MKLKVSRLTHGTQLETLAIWQPQYTVISFVLDGDDMGHGMEVGAAKLIPLMILFISRFLCL